MVLVQPGSVVQYMEKALWAVGTPCFLGHYRVLPGDTSPSWVLTTPPEQRELPLVTALQIKHSCASVLHPLYTLLSGNRALFLLIRKVFTCSCPL